MLYYAPAFIFRKRISSSFLRVTDKIKELIENQKNIPPLFKLLIDRSTSNQLSTFEDIDTQDVELYFPLPSSEEQRRIVYDLLRSHGIVVQGPPGTGKSHTIANLICHFLSMGKRILVSSHTSRALKVLHAKLPEEIASLCISFLGDDQQSKQRLEKSINDIIEKQHNFNKGKYIQELNEKSEALKQVKRELAALDQKFVKLKNRENEEHFINQSYHGQLSSIARKIKEKEKEMGWISDPISVSLPLDIQTFSSLLTILRKHYSQEKELSKEIHPDLQNWIEEFINLAQEEKKITSAFFEEPFQRLSDKTLEDLLSSCRSLLNDYRSLSLPTDLLQKAAVEIIQGNVEIWNELSEITQTFLNQKRLIERLEKVKGWEIQLPSPSLSRTNLLTGAKKLYEHLKKGKGLGWWIFRPKLVKETRFLWQDTFVNGQVCNHINILNDLLEYLQIFSDFSELANRWNINDQDKSINEIMGFVKTVQNWHNQLSKLLEIGKYKEDIKQNLNNLSLLAFPLHSISDIEQLFQKIQNHLGWLQLQTIRQKKEEIERQITFFAYKKNVHPICEKLLQAIKKEDIPLIRNELLSKLINLKQDKADLTNALDQLKKLKIHAPKLVEEILQTYENKVWDERTQNLPEAWLWAQAKTYIEKELQKEDIPSLEQRHKELEKEKQKLIIDIISLKSWESCLSTMTSEQRKSLFSWQQEVKKIGKGTGKHAETHRRNAQRYMEKGYKAIPAWIMPFYKLLDSLAVNPEVFDVIIMDEASQSGPEALILFFLAKQIIIVGDDQQISPEGVGIDQSLVNQLRKKWLENIDQDYFKKSLSVDTSLFDIAKVVLNVLIPLKEHFRCMPEIIAFSNQLCYQQNPLIPLRQQYGKERLEPLKSVYVRGGYREGSRGFVKNEPEADEIANTIAQLCNDIRYKDKTMGVISLQGEQQADIIRKKLQEKIGETTMKERKLICGDANAFQGDERDVIFLSMVAASNERIGVLNKEADKRRFNVAASRARDQLWLFHSILLQDLNNECMRYQLLNHFLNYQSPPTSLPDFEKCESQFEKDVARFINQKGYLIELQHKPLSDANYRIDILVVGQRSRLAVECDGPHHLDPEQIKKDLQRQRILEQSGLEFWRISLFEWELKKQNALEPLWEKLNEKGILPLNTSYNDNSLKMTA
ncbi:AAA domain-containing protein [Methylacidiphilum caldifontis]|uniref:DNA helicase n=1 Tax=Methylacidiphilum caldifontis TaxID=2795386 RepID=A0A4Y8P7H4_9BACT|nr:AAA domain-containing protein [Methylacidiphilum caldifontis]TFE65867.1 hypothetical protein A7Q10_02560 [Methylacidiphilum caldifontis]